MALDFQVLSAKDLEEVYQFAEDRLRMTMADEVERSFALWQAKWRREALEHYLQLGWSFVARDNGRMAGFFLAQPLLFFRAQTQTVWVECIEARDATVAEALVDVAVRVGREKHMQRVLFADAELHRSILDRQNATYLSEAIAEIKTTKG